MSSILEQLKAYVEKNERLDRERNELESGLKLAEWNECSRLMSQGLVTGTDVFRVSGECNDLLVKTQALGNEIDALDAQEVMPYEKRQGNLENKRVYNEKLRLFIDKSEELTRLVNKEVKTASKPPILPSFKGIVKGSVRAAIEKAEQAIKEQEKPKPKSNLRHK